MVRMQYQLKPKLVSLTAKATTMKFTAYMIVLTNVFFKSSTTCVVTQLTKTLNIIVR